MAVVRCIAAFLLVLIAASATQAEEAAKTRRPTVAIVALNSGTETTDFLVPYEILTQSAAVDVHAVAVTEGPVELHPSLKVQLDETIGSFDAAHPAGADLVIVPAVMYPSDEKLVGWLKSQAAHGATMISICDGIWALAKTGVLDGKQATAHWLSLYLLPRWYPQTTWIRNRRYVRDGKVMTTTGVTASMPASLALVEDIAGRRAALDVAEQLGLPDWDAKHDSSDFSFSLGQLLQAAQNWLAFWRYERIGIRVAAGDDEISLGLLADALGRTYRTSVVTVGDSPEPVRLKHGLRLLPGASGNVTEVDRMESLPSETPPAAVLDHTLAEIDRRYGSTTADFVAMQIEYPQPRLTR